MSKEVANTVMLTTKCSGACKHCPFSKLDLEKLFLSRQKLQEMMSQASSRLTILSGGEPFEHREISEILADMGKQTHPFRIATGGFVDLSLWIDELVSLSVPRGPLEGISIGTDVISSRVDHSRWVPIWVDNIQLLSRSRVPYSLTLTIGNDLNFTWLNLWSWKEFFDSKPEFIYLRYSRGSILGEWMEKLKNTFGETPILQDETS